MFRLMLVSVLLLAGVVGCESLGMKSPEQIALERQEIERQTEARRARFKSLTPEQQVEVYKAQLQHNAAMRDSAVRSLQHLQPLQPFQIAPMKPANKRSQIKCTTRRDGVYSYTDCQ